MKQKPESLRKWIDKGTEYKDLSPKDQDEICEYLNKEFPPEKPPRPSKTAVEAYLEDRPNPDNLITDPEEIRKIFGSSE